MKKRIYLTLAIALGIKTIAQVKIGDNPSVIGASSLLELESTNKGLLVPRVTNSTSVVSPVKGMIIFDLSSDTFKVYQNGAWITTPSSLAPTSYKPILDNSVTGSTSITAVGRYIVPTIGLSGGFTGQANKYADFDGTTFTYTTPTTGDKATILGGRNTGAVYTYSGSAWVQTGIPTSNYLSSNTYNVNDLVINNQMVYQANSSIPADSSFTIGTTGATWKQIGGGQSWSVSRKTSSQSVATGTDVVWSNSRYGGTGIIKINPDNTTFTLPAGDFEITGTAQINQNNGTSARELIVSIVDSSNNTIDMLATDIHTVDYVWSVSSQNFIYGIISLAIPTTIKARVTFASTNPTVINSGILSIKLLSLR